MLLVTATPNWTIPPVPTRPLMAGFDAIQAKRGQDVPRTERAEESSRPQRGPRWWLTRPCSTPRKATSSTRTVPNGRTTTAVISADRVGNW